MEYVISDKLLQEFAKESLQSRQNKPISYRKPKNGNLVLEVRQKSGLLTKIKLKESYIVGVLGIKKKHLMESAYDPQFHAYVLKQHHMFEGWFDQGMKYLKTKGSEGIDALKNKAMTVPNAIKKFGTDVKGITAALMAMVKDPSEVGQYFSNITQSVKGGISFIRRQILAIRLWFKERGLEKIADGLQKVLDFLKSTMSKLYSNSGWKGVFSLMAAGLCIVYINSNFKLFEKLKNLSDALVKMSENPKKFVAEFVKNAGLDKFKGDEDSGKSDNKNPIEEWMAGNVEAAKNLLMKSEFVNAIVKWVSEKMNVLIELKEKIVEVVTKAAGKALETLAGPIGWMKQLVELFGTASFVTSNLAKMLQNESIISISDADGD